MPSLHFTSPYGHVKPQLLQALSIKRKKSRVAAVAAAAVFKVFTNTRGRDAILRQGVKYRNMFHAGGGLVRERQPGEEVTPEKGWVTDEDSEHSEAEGSEEEVIPVVVEAEDVGKFDADQMSMEEEAEALVTAAEESAMDLIHEAEEVANTDLLKLEISLAEKEIPQVPIPEASMIHAKEEVVEAEMLSAQESTSERPIFEVVERLPPVIPFKEANQQLPELPVVDVEEQAPEQFVVSLEQAQEQEPAPEVDAVLAIPESQLEHVLEPSHLQPLSLASAMSLLEPTEREPLTLTTVMSVLQPSKPEPVLPMLQPFTSTEIADIQQPELILEVKEVEASLFNHVPEDMQVEMQVEMQVVQEDMKADDTDQQAEAEMQEALVEEVDTLLEKSSLEHEALDTIPNQTIEREPEVQETAPIIQPTHPSSIAEPALEVQGLKEEIVEKVIPPCVEVILPQPPQETLVLAVSEKHSEQLFDDGVCEYEETELSEDEEPEAELGNLELEGS